MPHVLILYDVFIAIIGFVAIIVSVFGTIRSHIPSYRLLILFYAAFTLQICTFFVRRYVYVNVADYSYRAATATYIISIFFNTAALTCITLYFHRVFQTARRTLRDIIIAAVMVISILAFFWPKGVELDTVRGILYLRAPVSVGTGLYLAVFLYLLTLILTGPKQDRTVRELVLLWSTFAFGVVGLMDSILSFIKQLTHPSIILAPGGMGFTYSTIPYFLFGGVLIYYFGTYLLSSSQPPPSLKDSFVSRYQISPREEEVVKLVNKGLSNPEIAEKLFISNATVKTHIHNVYEKTGAKSRYDLFSLTRDWP